MGIPRLDSVCYDRSLPVMRMTFAALLKRLSDARQIALRGKASEVVDLRNICASELALTKSKRWSFPKDVIGIMDGPRDLSQRKGLIGKTP